MLRTLLRAGCAVAILLPVAGALPAAGDDGPPRPIRAEDRPARTTLRPSELPELAPLVAPRPSDKEVILLVSGISSQAPDPTFDVLIAALGHDPRYEIRRFGADPEHPYDTTGPLDESARALALEIRGLAQTHTAIHLVAHSMGGAVVDRAFTQGLSADDHVKTYIALAVPHNGSTEARLVGPFLRTAESLGAGQDFRDIGAAFGDPGSAAVRDLALQRAGPPPAGVLRLDLRVATDVVVTAPDAWTPRVTSRTLQPATIAAVEGHGAVTTDPGVVQVVRSTIATGAIPPLDLRDRISQAAAETVSDLIAHVAPKLYVALGCCILGLAVARSSLRRVGRRLRERPIGRRAWRAA